MSDVEEAITRAHHEEWARVVASLTRRFGDLDIAEEAVLSDGPFVESKEYLAGVWVWEAPDLDVALKLAAEASKVCDRKIEVRPFL